MNVLGGRAPYIIVCSANDGEWGHCSLTVPGASYGVVPCTMPTGLKFWSPDPAPKFTLLKPPALLFCGGLGRWISSWGQ